MQILVRLFLSLEKLIRNPVSWFSQQPWLLRMLVVILLVPLISITSIIGYQKFYLDYSGTESQGSYEKLSQEIADLRKEQEKFHESQMEELIYLSENLISVKTGESSVLGADDSKVTDNLKERLETIDLSETDSKLIYIKSDIEEVSVFEEPSSSTEEIATLDPGSFHPALLEEEDWQQIYLGDGRSGWIEKEFIIKFPTNENR